jgi:valyl-tRNA synthetase
VDKAPAEVVEKEREKLHELKSVLMKLEKQLEKIVAL